MKLDGNFSLDLYAALTIMLEETHSILMIIVSFSFENGDIINVCLIFLLTRITIPSDAIK